MAEINKYNKYSLFKLNKGLRLDIPSWFLAPNQASSLLNVFYNIKTQELEKCPGYVEGVIDSTNFYCGSIGNDVLTDLVYKTIVATGDAHLCYIDGTGLHEIATSLDAYDGSSNMRMVGYGDYVILNPVSTAAKMVAYNPTAHTVAKIGAAPKAFCIAAKWGKVFAVDGRTIRWSNTWDHTTWTVTDTQTVGTRDFGDVRQMVEMSCCLYLFCQRGVYKLYYVGGDAFVYCELIDSFDNEFIPGSAACVHNKKIYFATTGGIYYTDGLGVYEYDEGNRTFAFQYAAIADNSDVTWYLRQACYYEPQGLYLLPIKVEPGVFGDNDCTFRTIVLDITNGGLYYWNWDFYAICRSKATATTGSDLIMLSAGHGDYASTGIDYHRIQAKGGYNFNDKDYNADYKTGLIALDDNIDTDKKIFGVEMVVESTGNYDLIISKGDEKSLSVVTHNLPLTGYGVIATIGVTAGGLNYSVGDVLTIIQDGSTNDATATVASIAGGLATGPVATVTLTTPGTGGYKILAGNSTTVAPAGGTGCTIEVSTITEGSIIGKPIDFTMTTKLFQMKFANNTADQNFKILGVNIGWLPSGELRRK